MPETPLQKVLNKNYYKKKPEAPFVKGRKYYFITPNKYESIESICEIVNSDGSGMFRILGHPIDLPLLKIEKNVDAWWRSGNMMTSGESARAFRREERWGDTLPTEYPPGYDLFHNGGKKSKKTSKKRSKKKSQKRR